MISTKSKILAGVFVLLLGVNSFEHTPMLPEDLPKLAALSKADITRLELTQLGQKIRFEKEKDIWMIKAPFEAKADQSRVKALLLQFRKPIVMDVMLERGEQDRYGLDASHAIVVEVWSDKAQADISFTLGNNAAAGSTFVRLSNDDRVYRARIGGRHRYDYPHDRWKNQVLFDFTVPEIERVSVTSIKGFSYVLSREEKGWTMIPKPDWSLDQEKVQKVLSRIGSLRIGRVHQEALSGSSLKLSFQGAGISKEANIVLGENKDAFVEIAGNRYQAAASVLKPLAEDGEYLRDKHMFNLDPRTQLDTISFVQGAQTITLQQDLSNGFWRVLSPQGMNIDLKQVFFMVNTLTTAEAERFITLPQDWTPRFTLLLRLLSGEEITFDVGQAQGNLYQVRRDYRGMLVDKNVIEKIMRAFGQGAK